MNRIKESDDFVKEFESLSKDKQKEVIKILLPKFCQIVMEDQSIVQEMMPRCMEMMKGMDFPMKDMMSKMMGKM